MSPTPTQLRRSRCGTGLGTNPVPELWRRQQLLHEQRSRPSRVRRFPNRAPRRPAPSLPLVPRPFGTGSRHIPPALGRIAPIKNHGSILRNWRLPIPKIEQIRTQSELAAEQLASLETDVQGLRETWNKLGGAIRSLFTTASGACSERRTHSRNRATEERGGSRAPERAVMRRRASGECRRFERFMPTASRCPTRSYRRVWPICRVSCWALARRWSKAILAPDIVASIEEDIRRIQRPSFLWKVARSLGLPRLRAARSAALRLPNDAPSRTSYRTRLREIRKGAGFCGHAPEDVAFEISRLFELHQRSRAVVDSLRLSTIPKFGRPGVDMASQPLRPARSSVRKSSGAVLFDAAWYLGQNPDIAAAGVDPLEHYLKWGCCRRTQSESSLRDYLVPGEESRCCRPGVEPSGTLLRMGSEGSAGIPARCLARFGTLLKIRTSPALA